MTGPPFFSDMQALSRPHPVGEESRVADLIRSLARSSSGNGDTLSDALDHHLQSGGKQMRAVVSLHCSKSLGLPQQTSLSLAAAVECLHNASLIQDDMQDKSSLRRGFEPVWKKYGPDTAICLTDLLISVSFASLASAVTGERLGAAIKLLHTAISQTLRGQMSDTGASGSHDDTDGSPEACLKVALSKSGPFFALSLELPLLVAGFTSELDIANKAAMHFGLGYQAYDDLEDLEQDEREGNYHNLVLAYTRSAGEFSDPMSCAVETACYHLDSASAFARTLPLGCGTLLSEKAQILRGKVRKLA